MLKKKGFFRLLAALLAVCILSLSLPAPTMAAYSFNQSDIERGMTAFLNKHYRSGDIYTSHFWEAAYSRELLYAYYELTGKNLDKISETWYWFEQDHAVNRFGNEYCWISSDGDWTDDYSWQAQFSMSAYDATGDQHILDQAKWHFDYLYSNNTDDTFGGGMWRERGVRDQKDIPTNGFAIVAAQLAKYYPDEKIHNNLTGTDMTYQEIAADLYRWMKESFMREDGGIENSFTTEGRYWDDNLYTYNAGIFIELAAYLYDLTKDESYLADARKATDFAKAHFTTGADQIVVYEDDVGGGGLYRPDPTNSYEVVFRGILMRGVYKLIKLGGQTQYIDWLTKNAQAAYNNRSGNDLTAPNWNTPYDGTAVRPTANATGLTLMCYSMLVSQPSRLAGKVEAESGVKYGTAYKQADHAASGGYITGSIDHEGAAVEFSNCAETQKLAVAYCSGLDDSKLSLYINDVYSQDLNFENTGGWDGAYTEKIFDVSIPEGATIKIQYDDGCGAANIDYIRLISDAEADKSTLAESINSAMELSQNDYIPASWALLQPAIDAALEVYNKSDALQAEVDSAVVALKAVVDGMETVRYVGKVEAEKGKMYGTAYKQADSGASEGFMVGSIDHVGSAFELKNCAASTKLIVAYASGLDNPKLSFYINGVHNQDLTFTKTGGWGGNFAQKSFDVDIPEGATIKFQYDSGDFAANIDYIGLTSTDTSALAEKINEARALVQQAYTKESWETLQAAITTASGIIASIPTQEETDTAVSDLQSVIDGLQPYPVNYSGKIEAEIGTMYGTTYKQADPAASGGFIAGSIDHVGSAFELINCAATKSLIVGYASGKSNPKLSLYINGVDTQDLTFTNTGGWNGAGRYAEKTFTVDIPTGASIKFQFDSGDAAANIDYVIIPADKTGLAQKVGEAQGLTEEEYTAESWAVLQSALSSAVSVNSNKGATQEEANAALGTLNAAIAGLHIRPLQVTVPTAAPAAGTYTSAQTVTLSCATSGAAIYYTTDGSAPTTASAVYTAPITVNASMTIKAVAVMEGMEDSDVAAFSYTINISTGGGVTPGGQTGGGSSSGGSTVGEAVITVNPEGSAVIKAPSTVINGSVVNQVSEGDFDKALLKAVKASDNTKTVIIEIKEEPNSLKYVQKLPVSKVVSEKPDNNIKLVTPVAELTVPSNMIKMSDAKDSKTLEIVFEPVKNSQLDKKVQNIIGNRPVVNLYMAMDGRNVEWNNPLAPVKVAVKYAPGAMELENPDRIVVYYIDGNNNIITVPDGRYDKQTGMVTFTTTHFSKYAIGYSDKSFRDVADNKWYSAAIGMLTAKGIVDGTSEDEFSPNLSITREEGIAWLVRTLGLNSEAGSSFDDTSDSRYEKEINIAKALGITSGTGNNRFAPKENITRQDLMIMLVKALDIAHKGLEKGTKQDIAKFKDVSKVSGYALESVATLVKSGLISGSDNSINPKKNITRAEISAILYKLYGK